MPNRVPFWRLIGATALLAAGCNISVPVEPAGSPPPAATVATAASAPTATDAPTAGPIGAALIPADLLAKPEVWDISSDAGNPNVVKSVQAGQVRIEVNSSQPLLTRAILNPPASAGAVSLADVDMSFNVSMPKGDGAYTVFGGLCRVSADGTSFYEFVVNGNGFFEIGRVVQGQLTRLAPQRRPPSSPYHKDQTNQLRLVCAGDQLSMYINGSLLETVTDTGLKDGRVGFEAGYNGPYQTQSVVVFEPPVIARPGG